MEQRSHLFGKPFKKAVDSELVHSKLHERGNAGGSLKRAITHRKVRERQEADYYVKTLYAVGYWFGNMEADRGFPLVEKHVGSWPEDADKNKVLMFLHGAREVRQYPSPSTCRVCKMPNGSKEKSDGWYVWPEGLQHYVEEHGVLLPEYFLQNIRDRGYTAPRSFEMYYDRFSGYVYKHDFTYWQ